MNRSHFLSRQMQYLFSFDLDLGASRASTRKAAGLANQILPSDAALCPADSKNVVYHALDEAQVGGEPAITGQVAFAQDKIDFPPGRDFGEISGRLVIRTRDKALIESTYTGVLRARAFWPLVVRDYGGVADAQANADLPEVETKAQLTTHFETGSAKYRWLVERQCAGFGRVRLRGGEPTWASFDIYSLA